MRAPLWLKGWERDSSTWEPYCMQLHFSPPVSCCLSAVYYKSTEMPPTLLFVWCLLRGEHKRLLELPAHTSYHRPSVMNVVSEPGPRSPRRITLEEPRRTVLHNCFHTLCSTPPPPWLVKWHLCVKFGSFPVSNNTQHGVWYSEMLALKVCGRDTVINLKLRPWLVPPNEQQPSPTEQNISKRRPFSIHRTSVEEPGLKC